MLSLNKNNINEKLFKSIIDVNASSRSQNILLNKINHFEKDINIALENLEKIPDEENKNFIKLCSETEIKDIFEFTRKHLKMHKILNDNNLLQDNIKCEIFNVR